MADPLLRLVAASGARPPVRARPLLAPSQARDMVQRDTQPGGPPSLFDQVTGMVSGLPGGIAGMVGSTAQSLAGFPRLAIDEAKGVLSGQGITKPHEGFAENLGEYFPILEQFRQSGLDTATRLRHPSEYVKAAQEGRIVPAVVEDAANVSILAAPAAKLAGAAAGSTAAEAGASATAAEQAGARAGAETAARAAAPVGEHAAALGGPEAAKIAADTAAETGARAGADGARATGRFQPRFLTKERFPMPSELDPAQVARPGLLRVGRAIEAAARPAEEVAGAPARVWTAPLKLARGVELPKLFGVTEEGAAHRVGLKPVLDATGVTRAVMETPVVAEQAERFRDWRAQRAHRADFRQSFLLPGSAEVHLQSSDLQRDLGPAAKVLGNDPVLTHATLLLHSGLEGVVGLVPEIERRAAEAGLPPTAVDQALARTFGMTQGPAREVIDTVAAYRDGTLDPAIRQRIDRAREFIRRPIGQLEEVKVERGQLHPEQRLNEPMPSRIEALTEPLRQRIEALREEVEGRTTPTGEQIPGLRQQVAQAQAAVPEPNLPQLVGQRARAAARREGAVEAEATLAGRQAEQSYRQAAAVGEQADRARAATLQGARDEMATLQRDRYGYQDYQPELTQTHLETGRAERAQGATERTGLAVPEDEYQLAERIARLEGEGRTRGVEQQAPRTAAAQERAAGAQERATAAEGRLFTGAAEPVYNPTPGLPFGEMSEADRAAVGQMSDAEAARYVRDVRAKVRDTMRERRYELENRVAQAGGTGLPIQIPARDSAMWDAYQEIQQAIQREAGGGKTGFRNPRFAVGTGGVKGGTEALFAKGRGAGLDEVLSRYGDVAGDQNAALEALINDIRLVQEWKASEGSVIKYGIEGRVGEEYTTNPVESAALAHGEVPQAIAAMREAPTEYVMPESKLGASPWAMSREDFANELGGVGDALTAAPERYEDWTPEQLQAERRLAELLPEALGDLSGLTHEQAYDRVRQAAQLAGRDVAAETTPLLAAEQAGRGVQRDAQESAREAYEIDQDTRRFAAEQGEPVTTQMLIRTELSKPEQALYDAIASGEGTDEFPGKAAVATERLGEARQRLTAGIRLEGERAGQRVGEAVGQERLLGRQAAAGEQRAETLAPRVEAAGERAQQVAESEAGRAIRFGERRGKRLRDVQDLQRELRNTEGRLTWLEGDVLPAREARLAEGPREAAPGKYAPALLSGERMVEALQQMGNDLAEQTGDPTMASAFADMMADVPTTLEQLHAQGITPEYLPGAVDRPTRGAATMAGGQEQHPWFRAAPSAHQKRYGHVSKELRTVQRSLVNDIRVRVEQDTAHKIAGQYATPGPEIVAEAVQRGELEPWKADVLLQQQGAPEDFAKQMEEYGYQAWDPNKPHLPPDRAVGPDSVFIPAPIAQEFQRWWKPSNPNGVVRLYDQITRGFKHGVLAMSPTWNVNNVMGNAFMAVVFGGESPTAIYRATRDVLRQMREGGRELRGQLPEEIPSGGRLSRSGQAVVNRVGPLRRVQEWGRDIGAAPPVGPPRLYGAGGAAEISRQFAEMKEPRTFFGRGLQRAYNANEMVDNIGRTMLYQLKKGKGYSDEHAVGMALQAMGDFNNMSRFERDVVRRIIPFYAWMRHITQASMKLAVEHPWRTAWMLHLSNLFNPAGQDQGVPEWLRGGLGVGGGWYVPFGGANPLQGNVGSIFTSPKNWPAEAFRSLNPVIKTAATLGGLNLSQARVATRPPGSGPLDQYGKPMWGPPSPGEFAYMALRQVPQGRLVTDLLFNPASREVLPAPVLRYDTGQRIERQRRPIPQTGGRFGGVVKNLNIPFFPTYVDEAQQRARIVKGQRAAAKARATYNA
jgi:hypothetical protein